MCSRPRGSALSRCSGVSASCSNSTRPARCSPRRAIGAPRTTSPAASADACKVEMMVDPHTAKAFDLDLQDLARMVAEMGGLAEKQIAESVDALPRRDARLAQRVVSLNPTIANLQ